MAVILIIDDEELIRESLSVRIERLNHEARSAATLGEGLAALKGGGIDLVFLDVSLPDGDGLEALSEIRRSPSLPEVVIITALGNARGAATAIKNGAWDYITKPFNKDQIGLLVKRAVDYRGAKQKRMVPTVVDTGGIVGESEGIKRSIAQIAQCAASRANVLILGETGTGKELFAKAVHDNDPEACGDYIVVDCSAMPETLAESVLFGHVKGAFTGADRASEGLIKQADKGTLFLDEIGELPLSMQKTFLRVLQEKRFRPVGSSAEVESDFRLISATNRNLDRMAEEGKFRQDLLHRLKSLTVGLPPLRERPEDIQLLAQHYLHRICKRQSMKTKALLPETLEMLEAYHWPGNVRELINALEKAVVSDPELPVLYPMFLPDRIRINFANKTLPDGDAQASKTAKSPGKSDYVLSDLYEGDSFPSLKEFREKAMGRLESIYLKALLKRHNRDLDIAAEVSDVSKSRLYYLIRKYNLKKNP